MEFLITLHNQVGVTQASIQLKTAPAHLPVKGDLVKYVDEDGNIQAAVVQSRTFNYAVPSSIEQLILIVV